jgi:PAS domain S-box-containing protein
VSKPSRPRSLRALAKSKMARSVPIVLDALSVDEVRQVVHELEVHKVELEIQNEQLRESHLAAEESKQRYRQLYDTAPIGYLTLDARGAIVGANLTVSRLLKIPRGRLIGQKLSSFIAPRHQDLWHLERRAFSNGERRSIELELALSDASTLQAQLVGSAGPEEDPARATLRLAVLDVTDLRSTERALRSAASAASLAEQQERRKLASDLHDDAGQLLSLASLKLRVLGTVGSGENDSRIREVEEILAEARRRVSSLSFELSPPLLHDVGLVAAAQWLAEDLERRYGLVVTVIGREDLALDEGTSVTLFRAMREFLINVTRHSGVAAARVRIGREGGMARVAVEDAGVGFSSAASPQGFGLLAIRERLSQLGGRLDIASVLGGGTTVVACAPLAPPAAPTSKEVPEHDSRSARRRSRAGERGTALHPRTRDGRGGRGGGRKRPGGGGARAHPRA